MSSNPDYFSRSRLLLGDEAMERLASCRVMIFGIGGVGGYVAEALARSGIGALDLCDSDTVALSNINRQIIATTKTVGRLKVDAAAERIADINPACAVKTWPVFYLPETASKFDFSRYDYIVDAVDTVTAKLTIIEAARAAGVPVISSMGAGNKLDPSRFEVADIYKTSVCPLAKVMRRECKKRGIESLKVVYSREEPITPKGALPKEDAQSGRRSTPGSVAFVPPAAGLVLASEVVKDLTAKAEA